MAELEAAPPDRAAMLAEAYTRDLLPPDMKAAYEEAGRRGLVQIPDSTGKDLVEKFAATPLVRGVSGALGLPQAVVGIAKTGGRMLGEKLRDWTGKAPLEGPINTTGYIPTPESVLPTAEDVRHPLEQGAAALGINANRDAETPGGRIAQGALTGAVGGALLPFGGHLSSVVSGLSGGAGGEAAGELTKGTKYETPARIAASLVAGGAPLLAQRLVMSPAGSVVRQAAGDLTKEQAAQVEAILREGGNTTLEAIQKVTGPNRRLATIQQVAEANAPQGSQLQQLIAGRAKENAAAMDRALAEIAPPVVDPGSIAPRIEGAAGSALAASPEAQALRSAETAAGPRTTPEMAGVAIQPEINSAAAPLEQAAREAGSALGPVTTPEMAGSVIQPAIARAAEPLADQARQAAWAAGPRVTPEAAGATIRPELAGAAESRAGMRDALAGQDYAAARASGEVINTDPIIELIAEKLKTAKGPTASAIDQARQHLFVGKAPDTSVEGLMEARREIKDQMNAATRAGNDNTARHLRDIRNALDDALDAAPQAGQARRNFAAASEPLAPFENGVVGKAIERGEFGRGFDLPVEQIAPKLLKGGPTEIDNFLAATTGQPAAREAFQHYVSTEARDFARGKNGVLDAGRMRQWLDDHSDIMSRLPGLQTRLEEAASTALAHENLVRPYAAQMEQLAPQILRGGPSAVDRFLETTTGQPGARAALENYIGTEARSAALGPNGVLDTKKLAGWIENHADTMQRFPQLQAKLENAAARAGEHEAFISPYAGPVEQIAPRIIRGGASAVDQFLETTAGQPAAKQALENYLSTELRGAAQTGNGAINPTRLRRQIADNEDVLNRFPAVRGKLENLAIAQEGRDALDRTLTGKLAQTGDLKDKAALLLAPDAAELTPLAIRQTIGQIALHDPQAAKDLARRAIEIRFNEANQDLVAAGNAFGGAKFRAQIMGNREQAANLEALVKASGGDQAWAGFNRLMDVFEAQGTRMAPGSNTAFNAQAISDLKDGRILNLTNWLRPVKAARDMAEKSNFQNGAKQIADAISSKDGLAALRALALESPSGARAAGLAGRALGLDRDTKQQ